MTRTCILTWTLSFTFAAAVLLLGQVPATSAPVPKEVPAFRLKAVGDMTVPETVVKSAAFVDDGRVVVVGTKGSDGLEDDFDKAEPNGAILDLAKKTCVRFTNGHTSHIGHVSVSGHRIATAGCGSDPTVRIWDVKAAKTVATITLARPGEVVLPYLGVAWFHKGDRIAVSAGEKVFAFDVGKPEDRVEYDLPEELAQTSDSLDENLAISPDDVWIVGTTGGDVICWNRATKEATAIRAGPEKSAEAEEWFICGLAFDPKRQLFAWRIPRQKHDEVPDGKSEADVPAERRGVVRIDLDKKKVIPSKMGHTISTHACALDPTGTWLATGGSSRYDKLRGEDKSGGELRVYHLPTQTLVHREQLDGLPLTWVAFSPGGKRIAAATLRWRGPLVGCHGEVVAAGHRQRLRALTPHASSSRRGGPPGSRPGPRGGYGSGPFARTARPSAGCPSPPSSRCRGGSPAGPVAVA